MLYDKVKQAKHCIIGTKQTIKAIGRQQVLEIFIASDAEIKVTAPIVTTAKQHKVPVHFVDSMKKLGKSCGIEVGTAVVAIKRENVSEQ